MRSAFLKTICIGLATAPAAFSLSLYDTAPPIGLPESHAIRYNAHVSMGFDDNLNATKTNKKSGEYASFGVGASYADYESTCKLSYHANVGGKLYDSRANGTNQRLFSDISGGFSMSKSLDVGRVLSLHGTLHYCPEPDYSNYISADRAQGDCFNWSLSSAYSQSIDSRWSWTVTASTSGNIYTTGGYKIDNRKYISTSASLNYKASTQTSYSASVSYRFDLREHGNDSRNVYGNFSVNHSIDPVSSCNLTVGVQLKNIAGQNNLYPNIRAGYRRQMGAGLSLDSYISLDNENVNTHHITRVGTFDYLSDMTWRIGMNASYQVSPLVSVNFGGSVLSTQYGKGTNGIGDVDRTTWSLHCGASYRYRPDLSFNLNYSYTYSTGSQNYGYDRNVVSAGVSYTF